MLARKFSSQKGITLIETIVAVFVVAIGLVSGLSLAVMSTSRTTLVKEKLVALYLAQEGLELVRNVRDSAGLAGDDDYSIDNYGDYIARFESSTSEELWLDQAGFYRQPNDYGDSTPATQTIYIRECSQSGSDSVECKVTWAGGQSVTLKEELPMWRNQP